METEIERGRNRGREGWRDEEGDGGREGERNKEGWRAQPTTEWVGMGETSEVSQGSLARSYGSSRFCTLCSSEARTSRQWSP